MGWCVHSAPAHFHFPEGRSRVRKETHAAQLYSLNVRRLPPVPGWTQSGIDPTRVEAGINRLLLPCPARLRPADPGGNRCTPQSIGDDPPGPRLYGRSGPGPGRGHGSRCASLRADRKVQARHRLEPCASCRRCLGNSGTPRPAGQTLRTGAAASPSDAALHPGGRRGDVCTCNGRTLDAITLIRGSAAVRSLHKQRASFDKLRMRGNLTGIKKDPHPELVEGRKVLIPGSCLHHLGVSAFIGGSKPPWTAL